MEIEINIAKYAGFCFGVRRAIEIAKEAAKKYSHIEINHDLVHNKEVSEDIKKLGIRKVKKIRKGKDKTLIIQAHGSPKNVFDQAVSKGYRIIDATCPMVKEIYKQAQKMEEEKRKIIIIGDKEHIEVIGIIGNISTKPIVINSLKDISPKVFKNIQKAGVVVQSTQDIEKTEKMFTLLRRYIKDIKIANTICEVTKKKQEEVKKMAKENDIMIIAGSKTSGNTKRLYQISKSINKNSYWIETYKDIKKEWFKDAKKIGISAGASTPEKSIQMVVNKIKDITNFPK